jgi:hypothetical protein
VRHENWMCRDKRTPEQRRQDRLRNLQHMARDLQTQLDMVREQIAELSSTDGANR